jgi:hypothetical protein
MAGIQDLLHRYAYGGAIKHYDGSSGSLVENPQLGASTTGAPTIPTYSTNPTIQAGLAALYGKSGDVNAAGLTDAQKAAAQDVYNKRMDLLNQASAYQTNQNIGGMYGITDPTAQKQFLTDFNTAVGFDPTTSANLMKGMSDPTTLANMNKEIGNSNFHYIGEATTNPNMGYQLNPSEQFIKELVAENTANPNKGTGNAILNQFVGDSKTTGNPFLGEYTWGTTPGIGVRKDALGNPIQGITPLTSQQLTDLRNGPIPVYKPASQSTNAIGDVYSSKINPITDQWKDASGYLHIMSGGKDYMIDPDSNRIISVTLNPNDPNSTQSKAAQQTIADNLNRKSGLLAKGGTVGMPQEYSQGNWKLI